MITITDVQRQSKEHQIYLLRIFILYTGILIYIYICWSSYCCQCGPPMVTTWSCYGCSSPNYFQKTQKQVQIGVCWTILSVLMRNVFRSIFTSIILDFVTKYMWSLNKEVNSWNDSYFFALTVNLAGCLTEIFLKNSLSM